MLLLPGPEHKGSSADEGWTLGNGDDGKRIFIQQQRDSDDHTGELRQTTFRCVWDGADVLARYLERTHLPLGKSPNHILELGAGCGLVGIAAGCLCPTASVTLTDLPAALPQLRANIDRNRAVLGPDTGRVRAMALDWAAAPLDSEQLGPYDLVLASDVIWLIDLIEPFLDTLQRIVRANPTCVTPMTYQRRSKIVDRRLFAGLECRNFAWARVATSKKVEVFAITPPASRPPDSSGPHPRSGTW